MRQILRISALILSIFLWKLPEPKRNFKTAWSERKDCLTFYLLQKVVESKPLYPVLSTNCGVAGLKPMS